MPKNTRRVYTIGTSAGTASGASPGVNISHGSEKWPPSLRALRAEIETIIGDPQQAILILSRLGALLITHQSFRGSLDAGRKQRGASAAQAKRIRKRFEAFWKDLAASSPDVQARIFAELDVVTLQTVRRQLLAGVARCGAPRGRPHDEFRIAVFDDVAFALDASRVPVTKARTGKFARVARAVLSALGDPMADTSDIFDWIAEAANRLKLRNAQQVE